MYHYVLCFMLGLLPGLATAATAAVNNPITLEQVMIHVLEKHPELKASDYAARIAAENIRQAKITMPVTARLDLQNFSGSGTYKGSDALETTLSFTRILELGNKVQVRGELATAQASLLKNEQDAIRIDLLAEATRRFLHLVVDQHKLQIANDTLALMQRTKKTVAKRVLLGRSPESELRRATIAEAHAEMELEHAEHELLTSRIKLSVMWGETHPGVVTAQAALFNLPKIHDFNSLLERLQHNPDIIRYASEQRIAEAQHQLAKSKRRSNIELSAGVRHFNRNDDHAFVMSAGIPLGSGSRAAPFIEAARLDAVKRPLELERQRLELHSRLFETYQELLHAQTAMQTLQKTIIPEAEKILRDYDKGYVAGRYSFIELNNAQQALLEARLDMLMTADRFHRHHIEIERLTGAAMPGVASAGVIQ